MNVLYLRKGDVEGKKNSLRSLPKPFQTRQEVTSEHHDNLPIRPSHRKTDMRCFLPPLF